MSNFVKYSDDMSLTCEYSISNFDFGVNTIVQIQDCTVINAVNLSECDIWRVGSMLAEFAKEPDIYLIEFTKTKGVMLSNIENTTPVDIYGNLYYLF